MGKQHNPRVPFGIIAMVLKGVFSVSFIFYILSRNSLSKSRNSWNIGIKLTAVHEKWNACLIPTFLFLRVWNYVFLTYLWPMFPFFTPWKPQKTFGFLIVFRGYKMGISAIKWVKSKQKFTSEKSDLLIIFI